MTREVTVEAEVEAVEVVAAAAVVEEAGEKRWRVPSCLFTTSARRPTLMS